MKKAWLAILMVSLALSTAACGKDEKKAAPATAAASNAKEVKIQATNFKFDQAEYRVKKGENVNITLENKQGLHGIEIKGLNVKLEANKLSQTIKADKAGSYDIICTIPCGTDHLKMKAKFIVE